MAKPCTLSEIAVKTFKPSGNDTDSWLLAVGFNTRWVVGCQCIVHFIAHKATTSACISFLTNVFTWHQAGTGRLHEMPMIFTWLSEILQMPIHPYFIINGPDHPQLNGGDECIYRTGPPLLVECFQKLLDAFGFSWHMVGLSCRLLHMLIGITRLQERQRQCLPAFNCTALLMSWWCPTMTHYCSVQAMSSKGEFNTTSQLPLLRLNWLSELVLSWDPISMEVWKCIQMKQ